MIKIEYIGSKVEDCHQIVVHTVTQQYNTLYQGTQEGCMITLDKLKHSIVSSEKHFSLTIMKLKHGVQKYRNCIHLKLQNNLNFPIAIKDV